MTRPGAVIAWLVVGAALLIALVVFPMRSASMKPDSGPEEPRAATTQAPIGR